MNSRIAKMAEMILSGRKDNNLLDANARLVGSFVDAPFWEEKPRPDIWAWRADYAEYENKLFMRGGNHKSANFEYVLMHGLKGHMQHIEERHQTVTQPEQAEFLDSLRKTCDALVAKSNEYAECCLAAAEEETCPERKKELLQMAEICRKVPHNPAESFWEAVQSYWFMFMLFPDGLGRIDQYLDPFYQADMEKGIITREEALELIEELFLKIFRVSGGIQHEWSALNHGVLAGYKADGGAGHNACTTLILEAVTDLPSWRPQVSYRVTKHTTLEQFQEVLEANYKRPDLVMFLNDDVVVPNLINVGIAYEDAVNYSESGCNETIVTGCSQMGNIEGHINIVTGFERLLKDQEILEKIQDFDAFYRAYEQELKKDLEIVIETAYIRDKITAEYEDPIQSLFTDGCIDSAMSIHKGGAKYNYCTWCLTGIVNMADSLSVIRQMVFEEKRFTLIQLADMLKADWVGYEKERAYILNNGKYFGNDDDSVDMLVNKIGASVNAITEKHTPYRGGSYLFGTLTGYELAHVVFGEVCMATPDGRHTGDPFAASITAYPGADKNGITSYLKSAAKLDGKVFASSVVVNLKLDRAIADTEDKRKRLAAIFLAYLRMGGVQLQMNYLSADELIKAQQEPEKYRNLRVRVTGFSGFFTTFDKNLQDELIHRSLHEG